MPNIDAPPGAPSGPARRRSRLYDRTSGRGLAAVAWLVLAASIHAWAQTPAPKPIEPYPIVANITFAEGPAFDSAGNLYFCNYLRNGTIGRMSPDGTVKVWCETGGAVNGLKVDRAGRVIGTDIERKRVLRIPPSGGPIEVRSEGYEGRPYLNPNDLCLDADGGIYFTDPSHEVPSSIYRIAPDKSVRRVAGGMRYPNGVAVSPDGRRLLVAETDTNRVLVLDRRPDGSLGEARLFHQFPDASVDGIAFDERGRLWVARWTAGTVDVLGPDGALDVSIPAGGTQVTNVAFFGKSLYVTVAGRRSIHRLDVGVAGAPR
jgi:sugar lactone lactonase YvrE